jgi:tetrahydromethanopterin S-methyltransferase subunit H
MLDVVAETPNVLTRYINFVSEVACRAGIEKPLVFLPVLDVLNIGFAARAIYLAKEEFGKAAGQLQ